MSGHFEFDSDHKILLLVFEGDLHDADLFAAREAVAEQIKRLQPAGGITDFSAVTRINVTSEAVRQVAQRSSPYPEHTATVIVAPRDHIFGLARMYEMIGFRTRPNLKIVRTLEEAFTTLGVKNPKFERVKVESEDSTPT